MSICAQHHLCFAVLHDAAAEFIEVEEVRVCEPGVHVHLQGQFGVAVLADRELLQREGYGEGVVGETGVVGDFAGVKIEGLTRASFIDPAAVDLHVVVAAAEHVGPAHVVFRRVREKAGGILLPLQPEHKGDGLVSASGNFVGNVPRKSVRNTDIGVVNTLVIRDFHHLARCGLQHHVRDEKLYIVDFKKIPCSILIQTSI